MQSYLKNTQSLLHITGICRDADINSQNGAIVGAREGETTGNAKTKKNTLRLISELQRNNLCLTNFCRKNENLTASIVILS